MGMSSTGAAGLSQMLSGQAARFLAHEAPLEAARIDLAAVQAAHPGWNRPSSWYTRTAIRVEHFISGGRLEGGALR